MNGHQLEFAANDTHAMTQADRMLARFLATPGVEVPMPELARAATENQQGVGFCVSRRIYDLRRRGQTEGFEIPEPRKEWIEGQLHTFYRLVPTEETQP